MCNATGFTAFVSLCAAVFCIVAAIVSIGPEIVIPFAYFGGIFTTLAIVGMGIAINQCRSTSNEIVIEVPNPPPPPSYQLSIQQRV